MTSIPILAAFDSILRRIPRRDWPARPGNSPPFIENRTASCPDAAAGRLDVEGLRESARRLGVLQEDGFGWLSELVRERLRRSLAERTTLDWERLYPGLTVDERAERHITSAARRTALCGGVSAAGAHVGEVMTLLTEGLAAPICVPAVVASIASQVVASAKVQIELVFDLASIYGMAFDLDDAAELAAIIDLALYAGKVTGTQPSGLARHPTTEDEVLARFGRGLLEDAMLGLVPFVGIPYSAASNYRATVRVSAAARRCIRRRVAVREALREVAPRTSPALFLEGAWLLAVVDGVATHDEIRIVAAIAQAVSCDDASALERLHGSDERRWLAEAAALDACERAALLDALVLTAGLCGPTKHPERCFLLRVGHALGLEVDFAQIDAIHRRLDQRATVPSN